MCLVLFPNNPTKTPQLLTGTSMTPPLLLLCPVEASHHSQEIRSPGLNDSNCFLRLFFTMLFASFDVVLDAQKKRLGKWKLDYANVNVSRHSIVKGTLVLTTKAVKSPSAALNLLNKAVPAPSKAVQPKPCSPVCRNRNKPSSEAVIAVNDPAFHVSVQ